MALHTNNLTRRQLVTFLKSPRIIVVLFTFLMVSAAGMYLMRGSTATGFVVYSPSDSDYPQKVDFVVTSTVYKTAPDDPIVYPGQPGASHDHTFSCSKAVTASSTPKDLWLAKVTNCNLSRDHASYWTPSIYANGVKILPYQTRAYYRAGTRDVTKIKPMPFGLRIVAGDAKATSPQNAGIAGFQCRNLAEGNTIPKQSTPPACPQGDFLEPSVVFPNCWDGKNLDSPDHKSHMSYAKPDAACDSAHSVRLPQLTIAQRYEPNATYNKKVTLASMMTNSQYTLHADFMNAWDPVMMDFLTTNCIKAHTACETISDTRMIPGKTAPPPATSVPDTPTLYGPAAPMDTTRPTVTLTAPAGGTRVVKGTALTLSASTTDNIGVTKVEFYGDGALIATATDSTPNTSSSFSATWNTPVAGAYALVAKAYDAAGNNASSAAVNMTVTSVADSGTGDINGDGRVNVFDLSILNSKWGQNYPSADLNKDGVVGVADLSILLSNWN
jgi:hypothetical protein